MQLVKQSYEILEQEIPVRKPDATALSYKDRYMQAMFKHIERCGRVCYHSTDKITEDSAEKFVNGLIKSGHLSVLEHGVIYLKIPYDEDCVEDYMKNEYSKIEDVYENDFVMLNIPDDHFAYITTTYRIIIQNHWEDDLQYLCEPTEFHKLRHTVLLHSCIHTYKDLTRHRKMSFSITSTRYVNYSNTERFGEMKFVLPPWLNKENLDNYGKYHVIDRSHSPESIFIANLNQAEQDYNDLIRLGWQPQQAAEILPQCTAADVVMSGYDKDWEFVFRLRSNIAETGKPHPLVEELMTPLRDEFKEKSWIDNSFC